MIVWTLTVAIKVMFELIILFHLTIIDLQGSFDLVINWLHLRGTASINISDSSYRIQLVNTNGFMGLGIAYNASTTRQIVNCIIIVIGRRSAH